MNNTLESSNIFVTTISYKVGLHENGRMGYVSSVIIIMLMRHNLDLMAVAALSELTRLNFKLSVKKTP